MVEEWEGQVGGTAKRHSRVRENGYVRQGSGVMLEFVCVQMLPLKLLDLLLPVFLLCIA